MIDFMNEFFLPNLGVYSQKLIRSICDVFYPAHTFPFCFNFVTLILQANQNYEQAVNHSISF